MVAKSRKRKTEEAGAAQPARSPMPNWTISVRDFGRVASAEIEMAPMVVLVGKNNTGKSYIASLLWAMMNADEFLFRGLLPIVRGKTTVTLAAKLLKLAEDGDFSSINQEKPTGHSVFKNVHLLLNDALEERKNDIFEKLFSYQMNVGAINVSFKNGMDFQFPIVSVPAHGVTHVRFKDEAFAGFELSILDEKYNRSASWILASVLSVMLTGSHNQNAIKKPVYFPAARTGLMLAYHSITARLFEGLGGEEDKPRTRLPLPVVRFLQCFTDLYTDSPGKLSPIVAALESDLIEGRVDASKDPVPSFWYEPDLLKTKLPLHATSSMITELTPFLLLLKNGFSENGLVFEEPEAHLHISAQRTLARLLVRIMNAGTRVVITTHSDTFIQQLNNLMQLHAHPKRDVLMKKFGYTAEDLLDPAMVKGYEFNPTKNGKTIVTPTKMNPGGLVVRSLNETLIDLAKELRALQSD